MNIDEQALAHVLSVLSLAQLVQIASKIEEIEQEPGHGRVTIVIKDSFVRYMEVETSTSILERRV